MLHYLLFCQIIWRRNAFFATQTGYEILIAADFNAITVILCSKSEKECLLYLVNA